MRPKRMFVTRDDGSVKGAPFNIHLTKRGIKDSDGTWANYVAWFKPSDWHRMSDIRLERGEGPVEMEVPPLFTRLVQDAKE